MCASESTRPAAGVDGWPRSCLATAASATAGPGTAGPARVGPRKSGPEKSCAKKSGSGKFNADSADTDAARSRQKHLGRPFLPRDRASWGRSLRLREGEQEWLAILGHLPDNVRHIWNALGDIRFFRRVLHSCAGRELRIPRQMPQERHHPLRRLLGLRCLRKLLAAFGGTMLYVPRCTALLIQLRQREIIESFSRHVNRGMSSTAAVSALARRHDMSDRRIWQILKKTTSAPPKARVLHRLGDSAALFHPAYEDKEL